MEPASSGSTALERGVAVGTYLLVQPERADDEERVWLARTAALPPTPVTVRLRGRPPAGAPSPFGQETQLGGWLQHPNLEVATEEVAVGTWVCAISAGAPGMPLSELLDAIAAVRMRDEAQWATVIAHILTSLLAGLDFAHRVTAAPGHPKGIVHGAVRPAVLLVAADGSVRLGGFGATRDDDPSRVAERGVDALAYAAPEQFGTRGRVATMDLWAAGAVLHELLDGRRFRGELTDVRVLYRVALAGDTAPLGRAAPEALERMRMWLLAKLPRDRPRSAGDAAAAMGATAPAAAAALAAIVRVHRSGGAAAAVEAPMHSVPPPAAAMPAFMPAAPMPAAMPPARAMPAFAPPAAGRPPLVEDEGTVELDEAILAAMRAGTRPPQPGSAQPQQPTPQRAPELVMPPPAARSSSHVAVQRPAAQPPAAWAPPSQPVAQAPYPSPAQPAAVHHRAPSSGGPPIAPPRGAAPVMRAAGPLELHPSYEPTTTTMLRARKSTRNFVIIVVVGAVVAIAVGISVGYLIVGDDAPTPTKAAPKPAR